MSHKILMVENDADDRYLTKEMFRSQGFNAEIDFIYSSALPEYLENPVNKPHLILLDRSTPPHPFTDLIKSIRRIDRYRLIPIVVLSSVSRPEDVQNSYSAGASSFIVKPGDYEGTLFKINSFIHYWFRTVELPVIA